MGLRDLAYRLYVAIRWATAGRPSAGRPSAGRPSAAAS